MKISGITNNAIDEGQQVSMVLLDQLGKGIDVADLDTLDYEIVVYVDSAAFFRIQ